MLYLLKCITECINVTSLYRIIKKKKRIQLLKPRPDFLEDLSSGFEVNSDNNKNPNFIMKMIVSGQPLKGLLGLKMHLFLKKFRLLKID